MEMERWENGEMKGRRSEMHPGGWCVEWERDEATLCRNEVARWQRDSQWEGAFEMGAWEGFKKKFAEPLWFWSMTIGFHTRLLGFAHALLVFVQCANCGNGWRVCEMGS